jgi:geranylgeranyl pyrophosphate synthase
LPLKRKQFHLSPTEEKVLQRLSKETGKSEAEIVREAINEYGKKGGKYINPLIEMAKAAQNQLEESVKDLSVEHDKYLSEILENEK